MYTNWVENTKDSAKLSSRLLSLRKEISMKFIKIALLTLLCVTSTQAQVVEWAKAMGSTGSNWGFGLTVDDGGNVISTGWFMGTVDFNPGAGTANRTSVGGEDVYVQKLEANGDFLWAVSFGGISSDRGYDITTDYLGNVYVSGNFTGTVDFDPGVGVFQRTAGGNWDAFVVKLDYLGNFVWARTFGGTGEDYGYAITYSDQGFVYTAGMFQNTVDFDPGTPILQRSSAGGYDMYVHKMTENGDFVWVRTIGGSANDFSYTVQTDAEGRVYHGGYFSGTVDFDPGLGVLQQTSQGGNDAYLQRLDSAGNHNWTRVFAGVGNIFLHNLRYDGFDGLYASGNFQSNVDFNPGPGTNMHTSNGMFDAFVVRLDTAGQYVWSRTIGGSFNDLAVAAAPDRFGNINVGGLFSSEVDMDPGPATLLKTSNGGYDVFVSKFSQSGNLLWNVCFGGSGDDETWEVGADDVGNIHTTGPFRFTVDFDPGAPVLSYTSQGSTDIFVHKIRCGNSTTLQFQGCGMVMDAFGRTFTQSTVLIDTLYNVWECDSVVIQELTVLPVNVAQLTGTLNPPARSLQLYMIANFNPNTQYNWQVAGGSIAAASGALLNVTWDAAGTPARIVLRSETDSGCVRSDTFAVTIAGGLSTSANTLTQLRVYPSPTADYFWVDSEWTDLNVRLLDMAGRQVGVPAESDQSKWMVDVRNLSPGLYIVWLERKGEQASRLIQVLR